MFRTTSTRLLGRRALLAKRSPQLSLSPRTYATSYYNATLAGLSPSEQEFREAVWDFGMRVIRPKEDVIENEVSGSGRTEVKDRKDKYPVLKSVHKEMAEMGLHGITVPTEESTSSLGLGMGYLHHLLAMEALSYASGSVALSYGSHSNLCINQISRWGTDEQRAKYLPSLLDGSHFGALAMSEPGAGSDVLGSMKTTARYDASKDGYILNGNKFWITNGPQAETFVIYAKDAEPTNPKKPTYTTFIVPRESEGFSTGTALDKFGMRGSPTCELMFDNVFVPSSNILGGKELLGKGAKVLMSGLDLERLVLSGGPLGIMQAAYDTALEYVHTREQFGVRVGTFGTMQAKLADMYTAINSARTLAYAVARAVDRHVEEAKEKGINGPKDAGYTYPPLQRRDCAVAILYTTDKAIEVALECMQCLGGNGYINDYPAARYLADARLYAVGAGTQEVRRWLIGREINADFQ
ncbi:hypothetical protein GYMLUDRAFT_758377 [Collybiopsis luxurians FD-317 M1]|uniref:Isovaleryl-CoA dehydrogenase n=1 Tax=Collybiopsis luxurians FD-317 M1 TaxID=944289 RepID=A0A0D0CPW7_9AGAR|nr:hypothetical protein GYMLUDRAFT_758377 [Collybiopsis luxurians FD-317 M1]